MKNGRDSSDSDSQGNLRSKQTAIRNKYGTTIIPEISRHILTSIPEVFPYYDDILIGASSEQELYNRVREVFFNKISNRPRSVKTRTSVSYRFNKFLSFLPEKQSYESLHRLLDKNIPWH
ncbi:hypothetical protein ALC56_01185 [Trachymyrmex septentrionalis]|uniref:Reverse transcriptase domain-containing protein n=1 Tax=Trachymyrmex septentrionalis TaxID=34720 RepID=A0A151K0W1_9HYME|nr:hypothetical protein ALC56_01185 [Trachymyrmex septentrionalis]